MRFHTEYLIVKTEGRRKNRAIITAMAEQEH